jgi:hypothetical protein
MSAASRLFRWPPARICATMALIFAGPIARADDVSSYCAELRQVATAALAREDKFASIVGKPRAGNYLETMVALPGWEDCVFYGVRTYTCDSHGFPTAEEGDRALARSLTKSKTASATAGPRIKAAHLPDMSCCTTTSRRHR